MVQNFRQISFRFISLLHLVNVRIVKLLIRNCKCIHTLSVSDGIGVDVCFSAAMMFSSVVYSIFTNTHFSYVSLVCFLGDGFHSSYQLGRNFSELAFYLKAQQHYIN